MKIIKPSVEILTRTSNSNAVRAIARAARTCYKSEGDKSHAEEERLVKSLIARGHDAMLEHYSISVKFICDRITSQSIVRHRIASFAQESTRYCNYSKNKFGKEITFIKPCFWEEGSRKYKLWLTSMRNAEITYMMLLYNGATPEEARDVLPNSLKTEIIMTANAREWRHFFKLRSLGTTGKPHPQMKEVADMALKQFVELMPTLFGDLEVK